MGLAALTFGCVSANPGYSDVQRLRAERLGVKPVWLRAGVSAERQSEWAVGPLVELELPMFYQGQGRTGAALAEMRREKALFEAAVVRLRAARVTSGRLATARSSVASYRATVLPLRARILEGSEAEYNAMTIGLFQLLEASAPKFRRPARG
jgi:outer membrane protein TolC